MDADVVYQIAQVLPPEEQHRLFNMLQENLRKLYSSTLKPQKRPVLTDEEAILYLIKNVFCKVKNS